MQRPGGSAGIPKHPGIAKMDPSLFSTTGVGKLPTKLAK